MCALFPCFPHATGSYLDQVQHYSEAGLPASAVNIRIMPTINSAPVPRGQSSCGLMVRTVKQINSSERIVTDWAAVAPPNPIPAGAEWILLEP